MTGIDRAKGLAMLAEGKYDPLLEEILKKYLAVQQKADYVVVGGAECLGGHFQRLDAQIAAQLQAPVVMAVDAYERSPNNIFNDIAITAQNLNESKGTLLGVLLNELPLKDAEKISKEVAAKLKASNIPYFGYLPEDEVMNSLRLDQVNAALGGKILVGEGQDLDEVVTEATVLPGTSVQALKKLANLPGKTLVVADGAMQSELILGLMAARAVRAAPNVAGVLVCESELDPVVSQIAQSMPANVQLPILSTKMSIRSALDTLGSVESSILPSSTAKIAQAQHLFEKYVDSTQLGTLVTKPAHRDYMNPKMFQHNIIDKCQNNKQRIVLPEGTDKRILRAASEVVSRGLAHVTLLGDEEEVKGLATQLGVPLEGITIINPAKSPKTEEYVKAFMEARKGKGIAEQHARDQLQSVNVYGVMMVKQGDADGMVSGAAHTTADTIRPALQLLGSKDAKTGKNKLASSVFFMLLPDKVLCYGDCAVNVNPDSEQLAQIAEASAQTASAFGLEPRVAMLSYATLGSNAGPLVEKVQKAVELVKPDAKEHGYDVDGPFQYDASVDPSVAEVKIKVASNVAGRANVLVFPDLNTGNNTYKAVQQSTGAIAMGPIMQGLRLPVNDLSRGCTVADVVNTICITSVQAMKAKELEAKK
jgi:phosphate acetyltransferase